MTYVALLTTPVKGYTAFGPNMTSFIQTSLSGNGNVALGATIQPLNVFAQVDTLADNGHYNGAGAVRRVYQAGWYGIGQPASAPYLAFVEWATFLAYEAENHTFEPGSIQNVTHLFWDIPPGGVLFIEVDW